MARVPPASASALDREIDALYAGPFDGFIAARKALAAKLKREQGADDSAAVARLAKPSLPAWALNQVYWHARDAWTRLVSTGDRLRILQQRMLTGHQADPREATRERQDAIRAVVDRAMDILRDQGHSTTDATRQRIAVAADAIAAYGSEPQAYAPGRLVEDLEAPGFAALASLGAPSLRLVKGGGQAATARPAASTPAPAGRGGPSSRRDEARAREAEEKRERQERRTARLEAERQVAAARRDQERAAREERAAHQAHAEQAREVEAVRRGLADAEKRLSELSGSLDKARAARAETARELDAAIAVLDRAREADRR
jgi:hypothetical protein